MFINLLEKLHRIQDNKILKLIAQSAFLLAILTEVAIVLIDKSSFINPIEGRLFQITFILCLLKVVLTKYDYKEYLAVFIFCLLGLMVDMLGDKNEILRMVIFVAACKGTDIKKYMKVVLWTTSAGCVLLGILSIFGILGEVTVLKEYPGSVFVERYCFGMGNANAFHIMFFALVLLALYLYGESMKWWVYVVLFVGNIIVTLLTYCKTGAALTAFAIALMALVNRFVTNNGSKNGGGSKLKKTIKILCVVAGPIEVAMSVYFAWISPIMYRHSWGEHDLYEKYKLGIPYFIDRVLTGRIRSLTYDTKNSGSLETWTFLPNSESVEFFDLGYVRLFYWYGILAAAVILLLFLTLKIYLARKGYINELVFLTLIGLFTLVEAHFVSVYIGRCYPLFILGGFWASMLTIGNRNRDVQSRESESFREVNS